MTKMDKFAELRKKAQSLLDKTSSSSLATQGFDFFTLLHELDTYRIELELQNDELQRTNSELQTIQKQLEDEIATHYQHYDIAPVGYVSLGSTGKILELNQTLASMLGKSKKASLHHKLSDFIEPEDQDIFYRFQQKIKQNQKLVTCQLRMICNNGETRWMKLDCSQLQSYGQRPFFIAISDISHLKVMEADLLLASKVFDKSNEAIMVTDANFTIIKINNAFTKITGFTEKDVIGQHSRILHSSKHDAAFYQQILSELDKSGQWQGETWNKRKNGEIYPAWLSITTVKDNNEQVIQYISLSSDITLRKSNEAHMHFMAYYDALTLLPNRVLLQDRLKQALASSIRNHHHGALFVLDMDHFKVINDSLGHLIGDKLLQEVAKRLTSCVRKQDTVCRMGGDEFLVLLTDLNDDEDIAKMHAVDVAEKITSILSEPILIDNEKLQISVSIGIVMYPDDNKDVTNLIKFADNAMYKVKRTGRNDYLFFNSDMQQEAEHRLTMQDELSTALERQQFEIYYQPQVDIVDNNAVGAEALIRWHHPERGLLLPEDFLPAAQETGQILQISLWVIEDVCRQIAAWNKLKKPPLQYVAINIDSRQFLQKNFVANIENIINENNINPQQLELELTEDILIYDLNETNHKLMDLKAKSLGIRLAIDDFGTGYSSLQYLKHLPIDMIKIDQSFVKDIGIHKHDEAIVLTVIALAKALGIKVLAEGVESQQQLDYLTQHDCDMFQGYLYSEALPADAFIQKICHD